ncbi:hypothetical protein AGRHK599_LOCUS4736 [Rhizobium rhizogenes]|uniref:Uncharacterized protein n=1 Tax=Rhizobium rhizogenes TaxID=359 RepID=A0AAN2AAG0_RHIRH|nr:hypothetical protein N434_03355 [Rhizobium sp. UGM030330-04]CAD0216473.1 hypothetical protein AGRHK599_LOCUS4736 [Rhizobium rhizogenes]
MRLCRAALRLLARYIHPIIVFAVLLAGPVTILLLR